MNKLITSFLPEAITKHFGYETQDERFDRLVTESIMGGPSKVYTDKDWDALDKKMTTMLDKINNK